MDEAVAAALKKHEGSLHLSGLAGLEAGVARRLVGTPQSLKLRLPQMGRDLARVLNDHLGSIQITNLPKIGADAIRELRDRHVFISGLEELSREAASALIPQQDSKDEREERMRRIRVVSLGIRQLSSASARALARHPGRMIIQAGSRPPPGSLRALCGVQSSLELAHIRRLTKAEAEALRRFGGGLAFPSLIAFHELAANSLSESACRSIALPAITGMPGPDAIALGGFKRTITFERLQGPPGLLALVTGARARVAFAWTSITLTQARAISGAEAPVSLDRLETLSLDCARALGKIRDVLSLRGLKKLSPEMAAALAKSSDHLILDGLQSLTPEVARALATHREGLSLDGLTELSPEVARILVEPSQEKDKLELYGLTTVDLALAKELGRFRGTLWLNRVQSLTPEVAEELIKVGGKLQFRSLVLTDEVAKVLLKFQRDLGLNPRAEQRLDRMRKDG
jgi:hypothetical protein